MDDVTGKLNDKSEHHNGRADYDFVFLDLLDKTFHINKRMLGG
jgi:tRNA A58 N-methylase Trm61